MKLLICTQTVDKNDPILGFFHGWIKEFSNKYEHIHVICLKKGDYDLPSHVSVNSLGKENKENKLLYLLKFYRYIWKFRNEYDSVFVHMNQEYVLLGGFLWRIFGKKIIMWRNHPFGSILTRFAVLLSHKVLCTSTSSFTFKFKKTKIMPAGIDTDFFKPGLIDGVIDDSILFLGRIDKVKRPEVLIEAFNFLKESNFTKIDFFGRVDEKYKNILLNMVYDSKKVNFHGSVLHDKTLEIYRRFMFSVNMTFSGSLDKTILEHMSCGGVVFISNDHLLKGIPPELGSLIGFREGDARDLAEKINFLSKKPKQEIIDIGLRLRNFVSENHGLKLLMNKIHEIC